MAIKQVKYQETKRELVKTELIEDLLFNKSQRVHSFLNSNISKTILRVDLPNQKISKYKTEKVISWAYWIGVGEEAQKAYRKSTNSIKGLATELTTTFVTPLAGYAVGVLSNLVIPTTGQDVGYYFITNYENAQEFMKNQRFFQFDSGKGIVAYGKKSNRLRGTFYIGLYNDNDFTAIDVDVKVVAIKEIKTYEDKIYNKQREEPIYVTLNKTRMFVKETKIRVSVE